MFSDNITNLENTLKTLNSVPYQRFMTKYYNKYEQDDDNEYDESDEEGSQPEELTIFEKIRRDRHLRSDQAPLERLETKKTVKKQKFVLDVEERKARMKKKKALR